MNTYRIFRIPNPFVAGQQLAAPPSFPQPKVDRRSLRSCWYYGTHILARKKQCSPEIQLVRRRFLLRKRDATCVHVYLRHGVILEVFVVVILQNVIIIKCHSLRSKHIGKKGEFFFIETLVQLLFFSPFCVLQASNSVNI